MIFALNSGGYGTAGASDVKAGVDYARLDQTELPLTTFQNHWNAGLKLICLYAGPYSGKTASQGVSSISSASGWATNALNWYKANTDPTRTPFVEVLNEPYGSWFWGPNCLAQASKDQYARILQAVAQAFRGQYGTAAPLILASYETDDWGLGWINSSAVSNPKQYVDGVTVHPYGGADGGAGGALGNRDRVTNAHTKSGLDVYVTELGWPTATSQSPTGDSQQWSESAQASNITNFAAWAQGQGWLKGWVYFCYHDFGTKDWYGVVRSDGSHKPAYAALHNAAASSPPPPSGGTTMNLDANGNITNIPAGAAKLHVALSATQTGTPSYPGLSAGGDMLAPFPASYRSPDPAKPWVSLQAQDSNLNALSAWTTPVQNLPPLPASSGSYTIPAESVTPAAVTPPAVQPPAVQPAAVQSHSHAVSWSKDAGGVVHISVDGTEVGAL